MGSMVVRNIPDDVLNAIRALARAEGKSAEQIAREALAERARGANRRNLTQEDVWQEIDAIRAQSKFVDWAIHQRIMSDAREERDALPYGFALPGQPAGDPDDH